MASDPMDVDDTGLTHREYAKNPCSLRKLPRELLDVIFLQSLPHVPSFKAGESPLLLTHVCGWWRDYSVTLSGLWDTLYLPSPLEGITDGTVELCRLWLERSGNRSLSVDFHLASDYQPWKIPESHLVGVHRVVNLLVPHAPRITKLLRVFPRFLVNDLRLENMQNLDDLFICDAPDDTNGRTRLGVGSLKVPVKLRCLSLRQTFFDLKAFSSLKGLSHLDLWQLQGDGQMSLGACLDTLKELHWLESCTLDVAWNGFPRLMYKGEILMPNLTFLFISWDWLVDVGPILDLLRAPKLHRLGLRGPPPTRRQWPHLKRFLKRCKPALSQLSIKEIGFADIRLLECLRLVPSLSNLSISYCSVDSNFIKALRINDNVSVMHNILSFLDFLSLEACDDFHYEDLIDMLKTRGENTRHQLCGIRLSFCRNILETHQAEIENCGIANVIIRTHKPSRVRVR